MLVMGSIFCAIAVVIGYYFSLVARCKGPILIYPWIWMDKEERERELAKVDIKTLYRQITVAIGCLLLLFVYLAVNMLSPNLLPPFLMWIIIVLHSIAILMYHYSRNNIKYRKTVRETLFQGIVVLALVLIMIHIINLFILGN
jgi:hypothetical protein